MFDLIGRVINKVIEAIDGFNSSHPFIFTILLGALAISLPVGLLVLATLAK